MRKKNYFSRRKRKKKGEKIYVKREKDETWKGAKKEKRKKTQKFVSKKKG